MENQHRKITGYRELTQEEIDLMNEIKSMESELMALVQRVNLFNNSITSEELKEITQEAEAFRWAAIARTDFQVGFMALVRAVAKPPTKN